MTMITPSYLGETIEYSSLHACRSTLEDPTWVCIIGVPVLAMGDIQRGRVILSARKKVPALIEDLLSYS